MLKPSPLLRIVSSALICAILASSCASSTMIYASPEDAKIYIDGEPVGKTPYLHTDTKIVGSVTNVRLEKEGYEPFYTSFARNEAADVGAIIGGLFVWVPFLWTMKYKPTHTYEMIPLAPGNSAPTEKQSMESSSKTKVQKLMELKELLDKKLITKEEYEKQKEKILEQDIN
ncbi:MAG: hypothetical protein CVU10_03325 [Bacteroidetes bacterium HGW-Bacteroidetes-5]|jgi:hypothetical protein|nr:MAG: hypothetical protein CVU10_03325 [Bacteroidetes bacterium HGW-Bacteroidetes-5]